MSKVLIVNAYAIGNRGDAAIVEGLIATLRASGADHVTVAPRAWREEESGWMHLGADAVAPPLLSAHDVPRWARRARALLFAYTLVRIALLIGTTRLARTSDTAARSYVEADVVVSAGGAYLGGPKVGINLIKAMNIAYARLLRRPTIVAPMTINPPGWVVGHLLRWALRDATVFVRDEPSRVRLQELGISSSVVPDLALRAPSFRAAVAVLSNNANAEGQYLCWSPRSYRPDQDAWKHRDEIDSRSITAVVEVMRSTGLQLRFIPQVSATVADDDRVAIELLSARLPDNLRPFIRHFDPAPTVAAAIAQFEGCRVLLASRLHASILAMAAGVPSLTVGYEPKVAGVLDGLGLGDRVVPADAKWTSSELAERLTRLMTSRERARTIAALSSCESQFRLLDEVLTAALARSWRRSPTADVSERAGGM